MKRFGRMEKHRGRPGAVERGGNLLADDAGLAHAGQDHTSAAVQQQVDGAIESIVEPRYQREDRGGFGLENLTGECEISHERMIRRGGSPRPLSTSSPPSICSCASTSPAAFGTSRHAAGVATQHATSEVEPPFHGRASEAESRSPW